MLKNTDQVATVTRVSQEREKQRQYFMLKVEKLSPNQQIKASSLSTAPEGKVQPFTKKYEHRSDEKNQRWFLNCYDQVVFGALKTCLHCTLLYYIVLRLDLKNN